MSHNPPPDVLYLLPDAEYGWLWCDDPAPGAGMEEKDAVKYIRADKLESPEMVERVCNALNGTKNQRQIEKAKAALAEIRKALGESHE